MGQLRACLKRGLKPPPATPGEALEQLRPPCFRRQWILENQLGWLFKQALTLPNAARVYIDTVTVIYAVEQAPTYGVLLNPLWNSLQAGNLEVLTSELTLMETLIMPIRNSDTFLVNAYERPLRSPQMQLIPISQTVLREAARLRTIMPPPRSLQAAPSFSPTIDNSEQSQICPLLF